MCLLITANNVALLKNQNDLPKCYFFGGGVIFFHVGLKELKVELQTNCSCYVFVTDLLQSNTKGGT